MGPKVKETRAATGHPQAVFRLRDIESLGLSRSHLRRMLENGEVERHSRGIYVFPKEATQHLTLISVCKRVPRAIVCLLSALQFHEIGTQIPREVWIAVSPKDWKPRLPDFPVRIVRFSGPMLQYGVETRMVDGTPLRITSPARTIVDCFRYRNKIGLDVALEALHDGFDQRKATLGEIRRAADACRARTVILPYLQSLSA